jgi:hypothetical protein
MVALVVGGGASGCSSGEPSSSSTSESFTGICADTCLKSCAGDGDCDSSVGEVCCDYGEDGNACVPATDCPRYCSADDDCESSDGEACLRTVATTTQRECTDPGNAIVSCSKDSQCDVDAGEKCCTIYDSPMCLAAELCPSSCSKNSQCDSTAGEICCTSFAVTDSALKVNGLCVNPDEEPCPTTCKSASDCRASAGEVCCDGVCSTSCEKTCDSSDECSGQVCCKTRAVQSPFRTRPLPGYQVSSGSSSEEGDTTDITDTSGALVTACNKFCSVYVSDYECSTVSSCSSDCTYMSGSGCDSAALAYIECYASYIVDCSTPDECTEEADAMSTCLGS